MVKRWLLGFYPLHLGRHERWDIESLTRLSSRTDSNNFENQLVTSSLMKTLYALVSRGCFSSRSPLGRIASSNKIQERFNYNMRLRNSRVVWNGIIKDRGDRLHAQYCHHGLAI